MQSLIEQFLQVFLQNIYGEGQRRLKLKALSAGLRALNGVRKLILLQYVLMICCFLCAAGILGSSWILVSQWDSGELFILTLPLKFTLALTLLTAGTLYFTVRERTWIKAMNLERQIDALMTTPTETQESTPTVSSPGLTHEEVTSLVGQLLDEKLAALAREIAKTSPQADKHGA